MTTLAQRHPGAMTEPPSGLRKWWTRTTIGRTAFVYLLPALIVMGLVSFFPLVYQVWMSTTDYGVQNLRGAPPNSVGLDNYGRIFSNDLPIAVQNFDFWGILGFNLIWTFTQVPLHVIVGVLIAVLLNVNGLWLKRFYRAIYVLPIVVPTLVVAVVWRNMFDQNFGAINQGLETIGRLFSIAPEVFRIRWLEQIDYPIPWLPLTLSFFALSIANLWLGWPFMTIVATGALQSIPKDLYEAASIDGASPRQQFFRITVPLIRPAMIPAAVYGMVLTFNLFNLIFLLSGGGPIRKTEILVTTAYRLVNENRAYSVAAAFSVIIFFVLLALTLVTNRITRATERYDV